MMRYLVKNRAGELMSEFDGITEAGDFVDNHKAFEFVVHLVWVDCEGNEYSTPGSRHDADVLVVTDLLDAICKSQTEYCTENEDYPNGCGYIVQETSHEWQDRVEDWVSSEDDAFCARIKGLVRSGKIEIDLDAINAAFGNNEDWESVDDWIDGAIPYSNSAHIASAICDIIDDYDEVEYCRNEYSDYEGRDCCLYSLDLGEQEEQIEINSYPELLELHEDGRLDDVLDDVNSDLYISRSPRREKQGDSYKGIGRDTYDTYPNRSPDLMGYHSPGGQWHYVVKADTLNDAWNEYLADCVQKAVDNS